MNVPSDDSPAWPRAIQAASGVRVLAVHFVVLVYLSLKAPGHFSFPAFTVLMNPPHPPPPCFCYEHCSQRGVYRATEVPRDHDTLRTIPMYGNMLQDHTSLSYFDALEEIAAVREAEAKGEFMPEWVPFSESEVCQLCEADFSWASTSKSEVSRESL